MSVSSTRRLVAIMFTDIVGYTALGQRDEFLSLELLNDNRKMLRGIFSDHKGREIKTIGDAFLVEFPSAMDAVRCAYDIQRKSREFNLSLPPEKRASLRVGIHVGDVIEDCNGDILGDAVNVASRIQPLAREGGVCLTQQVYDHVHNKFELRFKSIGKKSLKNVNIPIEIYEMVMPWETTAKEMSTRPSNLDRKRIAVLPFSNISPDPNDAYFADGMTEEIISEISNIRELIVISRTSVMGYKNKDIKVAEIANELNVGILLEGSVRKAGNKVRIVIQMIEASTDKHLWSSRYDKDLDDVFAIQSDIAINVARESNISL